MHILIKIIPTLILLGAIGIAEGSDNPNVLYQVSGSDPASSNDLSQYQQYYDFNQGDRSQAGPIQYMVSGSEPESLIVGGKSEPYDPNSISINSLWIQGSSSWTQYIKCPFGATFSMLAYSNGGPITMVEVYPDGGQSVNYYNFYPDYTRLIFEADAVGRHTMCFYAGSQKSNDVIVDVLPNGGPIMENPNMGESIYDGSYSTGDGYNSGYGSHRIMIGTESTYGSYQD